MKTWVYSTIKSPIGYSNNVFDLLKYYKGHQNITADISLWKCPCCKNEKKQFGASFVVNAPSQDRNIYLTPICLDCIKQIVNNPNNPIIFQVFDEELLFISKYDSSSEFINISIEEP